MSSQIEFDIEIEDIENAQRAVEKQQKLNYITDRLNNHLSLKEYSKINTIVKNTIDTIHKLDIDVINVIVNKIKSIKDQIPLYKCLCDLVQDEIEERNDNR